MINVEPMPNELCIAHKGRLAWINGCGSERETDQLIGAVLNERGLDPSGMSRLNQLALVSNLAPTDYARQHSMLPILRVAAKAEACHAHGSDEAHTYSVCLGMLTQSEYAHCCVECIAEDLEYWRFSWFRRTHHLTGVDWCPVHGCVLSRVDAGSPFSRVPHMWLAAGKLIPNEACQPKLSDAGFLRRYAEIATALLERAFPLQAPVINRRLAEKRRTLGLRPTRVGRHPQIRDRLIEVAPEDWLRIHLPGYESKDPLKYIQRVDSLSKRRTIGAGDAYAMAMAALYDSAEEAMLDVTHPRIDDEQIARKTPLAIRGARYWHGEIWSDYLIVGGNAEDLANRLHISRQHLRRMLLETGLPSLHNVEYSATWRAFLRFSDGQALIESCELENIEAIKLENLLRRCNGRVLTAVKTILAMSNRRPNTEKPTLVGRVAQYWRGEIWSDYLEVSGRSEDLANRLHVNREHLRRMLLATGLPSLHNVECSPTWRAFLRFSDGQTLLESCGLENIEAIKLENLLRRCNGRVLTAVKTILAKPKGERWKKPSTRKRRGAQGGVLGSRKPDRAYDGRGELGSNIEQEEMTEGT